MKVTHLPYSLLVVFILLSSVVLGNEQDEKKKFIEKAYHVNSSTQLHISNKFGKIFIDTWDKKEFFIKIEIIGKGNSQERIQRILDAIDVDISESGGSVYCATQIASGKSSRNNEGFEINYTVNMPSANPLFITNKFGDVTMGDRDGDLDLSIAYGSYKTGDIKGHSDIKLSFGSGSMNRIDHGEIVVKYSKLDVESASSLELEQGFSEIELGEVDELELESKYGDVEIEKANQIEAKAHFTDLEIEELTGSLELECSYLGDFRIERLTKSFTLVDIEGKYGSYEIGLEPGLEANIDAEFKYAGIKVDSDVQANFHYQVKESSRSTYRGKIGDGHPDKLIRIDSSYGNLKLKDD